MAKGTKESDSTSLSQNHKFILSILSLGGLTLYTWMLDSINITKIENPEATSLEGIFNFYANTANTLFTSSPYGLGYLLTDTFNLAASTVGEAVVPGIGFITNLGTDIFNSNGTNIFDANAFV